ncbi:MAG: ABC transporter ATP-binding protein [Pseudomonadales bacterium]
MAACLLRIEGLKKTYDQQTVFNDLSLQLTEGEIVAITGPSGCGKTTLLNLIAGLDKPDQGDIVIDGQSILALNEHHRTLLRRRSIGFIFQFFNLIPTLTVAENCCLPLELNNLKIHQQQVLEQLNEVGLATKHDHFPEQLSGGEQQRVAIIRALAHQPKLILADEPTGNLDQTTSEVMGEFLYQQVKHKQCALLVVTHSQILADQADRILPMHNKHLST